MRFDLRLAAGSAPKLTLACSDPASARWVGRILFGAYGRTAWVHQRPSVPDPAIERLWGRRVRAWPEVLRESSDGPSAFDSLALAMSGVTGGVSVRASFLPFPATWNRPHDVEPADRPRPTNGGRGFGNRAPLDHRRDPVVRVCPLPLFWKAHVGVVSPPEDRGGSGATDRVRVALEAALRSGQGNGVRFFRSRRHLPWSSPWFFLSEDELACLLPGIDVVPGSLEGQGVDGLPVLPLGRSMTGRVVGPPVEPDQGRHLTVLGETGMGKSSTLVAVARSAATLGGVVLFDPLGETARSFLSGLSDRERSRLVGISPLGPGSGINALEGIGGRETDPVLSDRRLNDLVHALRRVRSGRYDSTYWGPRLEEMLTRAVAAAAAFPSGTLVDAHTLLATGGRTRQVVPPEAQEAVRELSDRIRERPEDAEGARRLLYEVVRSPVLQRMLCERNPVLHARELVGPDRIAVISGDASLVGESVARYLLAVYLALVWSELLARRSNPKTFVVLDESQWFSHESLSEMLRLARRRNVHVVLATQTVGSLPEAVADAVWTNVSDFVAFRGSPEEARELSRATRGLSVEDLLALPRGHAAVLLGKGNSLEWVRTAGRPAGLPRDSLDTTGAPAGRTDRTGQASPSMDGPPATVETVLAWIRKRARALPAGQQLRVELAELRMSVDPSGRAIRDAGSRLGRAGALVTGVRSTEGSVWVLDPTKIPAEGPEPPTLTP